MKEATKVHIVPHMHWDREWYFSAEESKYLLINNMEEIFDMLENNDDYPCYILDGQTAIIEDYLQYKPENKEQLTKLVQSGKLRIGPWYTQTDTMVVGGESITRNLLYGQKDCHQFSDNIMEIGYLPDSFGQSGQLPMIFNGFGIDKAMFWRGTSERMGTDKTEFYHESCDGSKVLCQLLPLGYAIGKYLPVEEDALRKRMDKYFPVLDKGATSNHIIIPNGHDQMPIQKNIFDVINKLKECYPTRDFYLSDYESVFEELEKKDDYATLKSEFLDGKYMRVHRSIYSSRADIKTLNTRIENKLTNVLEPLASIARSLGFDYFSKPIEIIWKDIMKNHAHDSIGCCCSDKVHNEIINRFTLAEEKIDQMIKFYKRKIVDSMSCDITLDKLTFFNLLPYLRKEVVEAKITTKFKDFNLIDEQGKEIEFDVLKVQEIDAGIIDRQLVHYGNYDPFYEYTIALNIKIAPMGFTTLFIKEKLNSKITISMDKVCNNQLENEFYQITINNNGTLNILDKTENQLYEEVLMIEDSADDGDGYDYSPIDNDWILTSKNCKADIIVKHDKYLQEAIIKYNMEIPKNLDSRKNRELGGYVDFEWKLQLRENSKLIDIKLNVDNQAKDHRIRMVLPTKISSNFTFADNQFGNIKRAKQDPAMKVWKQEHWSERPDAIYPMLSFVKMENDKLSFITNSIREYEAVDDNLYITLYRCTEVLGKEDLLRRPGRPSGIKLPTPDQQLMKKMHFDFAITYVENDEISKIAKEYLTPIVTYNKMPYNAMKLNASDIISPYSYSLFEIDNDHFVLSAFKESEDKKGYILRGYNPLNHDISIKIGSDNLEISTEVRLDEKVIKTNDMFNIQPCQVKTYKLSKR